MKNVITAVILAMVLVVGTVGCSSKTVVEEVPETVVVEERG